MGWLGCSICEDPRLVFTTEYDGYDSYRWVVHCGNGHQRVATPGTVFWVLPGVPQPAETAELD